MKLGILGGTFNPIHTGHVHLAVQCASALALDEVLLIPTALPPHKSGEQVVSGAHRAAMCRLAIRGQERLSVCEMELSRGGASYTIDTLRALKAARPCDEFWLLMGSDMFYTLESWRCADEILKLAGVATAAREQDERERLYAQRDRLIARGASAEVVELSPIVTSSTEIRAGGKPDTIPTAVELYIRQNGLYGRPMTLDVDLDAMTRLLRANLSRERFLHTLNVASEAIRLARAYGFDGLSAYVAGLLHDRCKELPPQQMLKILEGSDIIQDKIFLSNEPVWHGYAAAISVQDEFSIYNTEILDAVRYHSTGRAGMSPLEQIIYLSDLISAEREFSGVEQLRAKAYRSLAAAMFDSLQFTVEKLISKGQPVLKETFEAYNLFAQTRG